ncbi:hypothetical protein CNYM01_07832 [Colletotrichum nymphaeae SA-01]|uniref:Uncharacterized protein n=1 Tax=Colletotrichum nymphaeae SA-01 TaxID=1460502 RepID=A0A135SGP5_9PEZI|nr:hypothetical protein CNYM01_07832 [Colletotrichum nymphaeae SA-01]
MVLIWVDRADRRLPTAPGICPELEFTDVPTSVCEDCPVDISRKILAPARGDVKIVGITASTTSIVKDAETHSVALLQCGGRSGSLRSEDQDEARYDLSLILDYLWIA